MKKFLSIVCAIILTAGLFASPASAAIVAYKPSETGELVEIGLIPVFDSSEANPASAIGADTGMPSIYTGVTPVATIIESEGQLSFDFESFSTDALGATQLDPLADVDVGAVPTWYLGHFAVTSTTSPTQLIADNYVWFYQSASGFSVELSTETVKNESSLVIRQANVVIAVEHIALDVAEKYVRSSGLTIPTSVLKAAVVAAHRGDLNGAIHALIENDVDFEFIVNTMVFDWLDRTGLPYLDMAESDASLSNPQPTDSTVAKQPAID